MGGCKKIVDYATIKYIQQKILKPKIESYTEKVIIGVDNFEEYKYITGQIRSLKDLQQDLTDLLRNRSDNDDYNNAEGAED